jgi:hypothetical protein
LPSGIIFTPVLLVVSHWIREREMATIRDLLSHGVSVLKEAGHESARLEAQLLLESVLGVERAVLYGYPERNVETTEGQYYRELIARRAQGEPVAYLTGIGRVPAQIVDIDACLLNQGFVIVQRNGIPVFRQPVGVALVLIGLEQLRIIDRLIQFILLH